MRLHPEYISCSAGKEGRERTREGRKEASEGLAIYRRKGPAKRLSRVTCSAMVDINIYTPDYGPANRTVVVRWVVGVGVGARVRVRANRVGLSRVGSAIDTK